MCGIVGGIAQRDVAPILLEGLRRLEYRGYDSAGMAVISDTGSISLLKRSGKVEELCNAIKEQPVSGGTGIAHTRWATHGVASERNAHPHISEENIAVVHNGIIENHEVLRGFLVQKGFRFYSDTDTEVIAHLITHERRNSKTLLEAVQKAVRQLEGAYGMAVMDREDASRLVAARSGSPLIIGVGIDENFIASDQLALFPVTRRFIFLEEGDVAEIRRDSISIFDRDHVAVERLASNSEIERDFGDRGSYRHYMLKEIHEQPEAVTNTVEGCLGDGKLNLTFLGNDAAAVLETARSIQIVACGTSYHAGMVASYWFEELAGIPCRIDIASEFRYRKFLIPEDCLFVCISQSGETADTMAALRQAKEQNYIATLSICNVRGSSMVRESDFSFMTRAGSEIGVASTKAFTTQLTALLMLVTVIGRHTGITEAREANIVKGLRELPNAIKKTLELNEDIEEMAKEFSEKHNSLFLGRGSQYPIAMEGALKLKEISYIHAEAYAAGELKHGPLALIDSDMPVIVVAPNNDLLEKLKSNMEEVRARGGLLYVFADRHARLVAGDGVKVLPVEDIAEEVAPILYTVPLQLLAYYVAVIKGTDIDQPRNLAKSVTVE
ncbi:MAG: glutamine--fructose-6-phosphate transaminase (isomerizing) [Candidatus Endonucleobacter bathymodioli]|uniref:Glutamine--fructose-6-phosphate aminotransferase [isomerizing] n=1 Tax=Candidatus Endonucleibacter bathymodioli TaxID=539814 RepID=A0AA90NRJ7_9GAMM|nr:glutamine--fructose-6-phosphate transaminase (isomerizing) [Candidatus Endonucleobacter bathymodioli]